MAHFIGELTKIRRFNYLNTNSHTHLYFLCLVLTRCFDANEQVTYGVQVDPVKVPQGPVTRARGKRFKESRQALVHTVQAQEKLCIEGIDMEDPCKTTKMLLTIEGANDQASIDNWAEII